MRTIGIDFGEKRVGIAVSDQLKITAQPVAIIENLVLDDFIRELTRIIEKYSPIDKIVVGLPKGLKNIESGITRKADEFICQLKDKLDLPIIVWDERFTTKMAKQVSNKKHVDQIAAAIILQDYLNRNEK